MDDFEQKFKDTVQAYKDNCVIIRQVNSSRLTYHSIWNIILSAAIIFTTLFFMAIGFMDKDSLICFAYWLGKVWEWKFALTPPDSLSTLLFNIIYNFSVLLIFGLTIILLIARPQERAFEHSRVIIVLSNFIRDIDYYLTFDSYTDNERKLLLHEINARYTTICDFLPKHTDWQYRWALWRLRRKKRYEEKYEATK